jgi:hypothetical protein
MDQDEVRRVVCEGGEPRKHRLLPGLPALNWQAAIRKAGGGDCILGMMVGVNDGLDCSNLCMIGKQLQASAQDRLAAEFQIRLGHVPHPRAAAAGDKNCNNIHGLFPACLSASSHARPASLHRNKGLAQKKLL